MYPVLGNRIRELRLDRNYSQEAVAVDLGVSPKTLSAWERGTRAIALIDLAAVARYFDTPLSDLVHGLEHVEGIRGK